MSRCARSLALPHLWTAMILLATPTPLLAQTPARPPEPYAAINRSAINYTGPGRERAHDLPGLEIKIGLIIPLTGARKSEGEALLAAAQLAIEDEAATPIPGGVRLALATRDEGGLWGRASSEIVKLVVDDRAVALITSPDGRAAHLSEQVGNRLSVPVLSLASDSQNTQINIPWYFRVVPDDAAQARLFAEDIYRRRSLQRVVVVFESDHDGKVGREEFNKAARRLHTTEPASVEIATPTGELAAVIARINEHDPQAIVLWTSADVGALALAVLSQSRSTAEIYVCHKAFQEPFTSAAREAGTPKIWTAAARVHDSQTSLANFDQRFRERIGIAPDPAARAMYDAIGLIAAGVRATGPNRARLRDSLARIGRYQGVSGLISFDGAGNNQAEYVLVALK